MIGGARRWSLAWALAAAGPAVAGGAEYGFDPTHTQVRFEVRHGDLSLVRGRFGRQAGTLHLDREGREGRVEVTVEIATLNTGVAAIDRLLLGATFLDAAAFPVARFESDRFAFDGDRVTAVEGRLTLHGATRALTLQARRFGCYFSPLFRREVCGGDFEARLRRSDWGIGPAGGDAGDEVQLIVAVEAIRS